MIPAPGTTINARINEVFSRLQAWHLVLRSDQKGPSPDSSHADLPKRYLFDTGLLRHFRELGMPSINVLKTRSAAARGPLGVIVSFAAYGITEIVAPGSRRKRRVVTLPAPLLERLSAIIDA